MMIGLLPGLIVALPFLAAAIIRIPGISGRRFLVDGISVAAAAATAAFAGWACAYGLEAPIVHWIGGWEPREETAIGITLVADGTAAGFVALAAALTTGALLFMSRRYEVHGAFLHVLTLVFLGAFAGFVLAGDLLTMFVFLELMGISSYILTAFKVQDDASVQAAFNVAVVSTVGAFVFLLGVTMIYGIAGTPNLAEIADRLADVPMSPALAVAFGLVLIGLGIKSGLLPFHFAHVDSHSVAPAPHAGLFGVVLLQAALYGVARLSGILFDIPGFNPDGLRALLVTAGVATALIAASMSVVQNHLKRLLAFSSVAHLGIAAVGVGLLETDGLAGAGLYIAGHAAVKMALFLTAGILLHRFASMHLSALAGRGREAWPLVGILVIGAVALAGAPPSGLYGGKVFIEEAAIAADLGWIVLLLYLAAALTGAAVIRVVVYLLRPPTDGEPVSILVREGSRETHPGGKTHLMTAIPFAFLAIGLLIPLVPHAVAGFETAAEHDYERLRYVESVLEGVVDPAEPTAPHDLWKVEDMAKGILSAAFALLIGVVTTLWHRPARAVGGPLSTLRRLHSGHVGDYVVWLTLGAAVAAAWLLWWL